MSERGVLEEMGNIRKNHPLWPGDTISHQMANECVRRGWARRDGDQQFVPTPLGIVIDERARARGAS